MLKSFDAKWRWQILSLEESVIHKISFQVFTIRGWEGNLYKNFGLLIVHPLTQQTPLRSTLGPVCGSREAGTALGLRAFRWSETNVIRYKFRTRTNLKKILTWNKITVRKMILADPFSPLAGKVHEFLPTQLKGLKMTVRRKYQHHRMKMIARLDR